MASSLNLLGLIQQARGHKAEAEQSLLKALELNQASLGTHANTASVAWNLGNVQKAMQQPRKAVQSYRRALEVAQALPADAVSLALREKALQALGDLLASLGEHDQAQAYLQQLSALPVDAAAQADVATRVQALLALAHSQEQQGRLQPAQQAWTRQWRCCSRQVTAAGVWCRFCWPGPGCTTERVTMRRLPRSTSAPGRC
jgi:tetratricopeptide (TPR) repeat protein